MSDPIWLALIGVVSGTLLGISARLGRFCSLGAIEDIVYGGRYYRLLMWPSAIGWALIFMGMLISQSWFDASSALYLRFEPNYFAHIAGGLLFGFGMALAGMCGFTGLARFGTGDMRAVFVIIVMGIFAYIAASGPLASLRVALFDYAPRASEALPSFAAIGAEAGSLNAVVFWICGALLVALPLLRGNFRRSPYPLWGALVGFAITLGWAGTAWIAEQNLGSSPIESHTFSLPLGDTLLYLMTSTGSQLTFAVGSVTGVILGGLIGAIIKNEFSWEACDDARELRRHIAGAALMGTGAVIALGCSIGQGLSAMAVLYMGAPITLLAIMVGAYIGLRYLVEG